jgi:hypothetical protein
MARDVIFYTLNPTKWATITPEATSFYHVVDTTVGSEVDDLYLGTQKLNNADDLAAAVSRITTAEGNISALQTLIGSIPAGASATTIVGYIQEVAGDLTQLETTDKSDLVSAINELKGAIDGKSSVFEVTITGTDSYSADKTFSEISTAISNDMLVYAVKDGTYFVISSSDSSAFNFSSIEGDVVTTYSISSANAVTKTTTNLATDTEVSTAVTTAEGYADTLVGDLSDLDTTDKTDVVSAINEVKASADDAKDASNVSITDTAGNYSSDNVEGALAEVATMISDAIGGAEVTVDDTVTTAGYLKSYRFYQGDDGTHSADNLIATIDIPKDFLVKSGSVVENPAGQPAGTYIALVLNTKDGSGTDETIYINVGDLIEYVTGGDTAEVSVSVDSTTHVVTATIVKIPASKVIYREADAEQGITELTIAQALDAETARAEGVEGDLTQLDTTNKSDLVSAINEVKGAVDASTDILEVVVTESSGSYSANKTLAEMVAADTAGKLVYVTYGGKNFVATALSASGAEFTAIDSNTVAKFSVSVADVVTYAETVLATQTFVTDKTGNLANLDTTEKTNLVGAVNEVKGDVADSLAEAKEYTDTALTWTVLE